MSLLIPAATPQICGYADATIAGTDYTSTPRIFNIPNWQLIMSTFQTGITTLTAIINNNVNIWSGSSSSVVNIYFTKDQSFLISDLQLEINLVTAGSGTIQFVPTDCMFNQVQIQQGATSGIMTFSYPWSKMMYLACICSQGILDSKLKESNYSYGNYSLFAASGAFAAGTTCPPMYYTLGCSFLNKYFGLYFLQAAADLAFNLYPATTITAASTGSPTFTLPSMRILVQTRSFNTFPGAPDLALENIFDGQAALYLDPVYFLSSNITLGPGATSNPTVIPNLQGYISHIGIFIYTAGQSLTNTGNAELSSLWYIGGQGTIDYQTATGQSLLFNNTPIKGDYLRFEIGPDYIDNSTPLYWNGCHIVPITSNIINAYSGKIDGCVFEPGNSNNKLVIIGSGAYAQEVWTITKVATFTAGYWSLFFYGQATDPVAYNAGANAWNTAFNAHPYCQARSITGIYSADLSTGATSITLTLTHPRSDGLDRTKVTILPGGFASGAGVTQPTIACTTNGVCGVPTGSYDVLTVGLRYRWVNYYGGQLIGGDIRNIRQLSADSAKSAYQLRKDQIKSAIGPLLAITG